MAAVHLHTMVEKANHEIILNCKSEETVKHALFLLQGEIKPYSIGLTSESLTNEPKPELIKQQQTKQNGKDLPITKASEVLVYHNGKCHGWPLVDKMFKAFLKLDRGVNLVKVRCDELAVERDLQICYEKQMNQPRFVRVVYIKCSDSDGSFDAPENKNNSIEIALKKLSFNARLLQTFMAEDMNRHGFGYQTFELEENDDGTILIHVFSSGLTTEKAHQMNGDELYSWFLEELTSSSKNDPNCKFLAFMSCSHYDPPEQINAEDIPRYVKAHTALGGGQLGLFGTAGLHTWAEDVGELVKCFTDQREIDKRKLFDDSAKRGTFWANYSTTLGAALHELGHCFDLMHMPEGIMARGFDDIHHFAVIAPSPRHCLSPADSTVDCNEVVKALRMFADHSAHWFRSSAVLLHYHRWLNPYSAALLTPQSFPFVNWSPDVKGPIGNSGGRQDNQSYFDDITWYKSRNLAPTGYVIYHGEYINAIKPLADEENEGCPVYGVIDRKCSTHTFHLEQGEYLTSLEVRAGAWIDGIRFHSNMKSSIWFGGQGGDWYRMTPAYGETITGIFGTYGKYVGSLGVRLSKCSDMSIFTSTPTIQSDIGIGLVELRENDELLDFREFVQRAVTVFSLPESWWNLGTNGKELCLVTVDVGGNISRFCFVGYEKFVENCSLVHTITDADDLKVLESR